MDEIKKRIEDNREKLIRHDIEIVKLNNKIDNLNKLDGSIEKLTTAVNRFNIQEVSTDYHFLVIDTKLDDINRKMEENKKLYEELAEQRNIDHEKKPLETIGKIIWIVIQIMVITILAKLGLHS